MLNISQLTRVRSSDAWIRTRYLTYTNILSKNAMNLVHATVYALVSMKDAVAIANKRGITIGEVFG